jgi:hypothetical protein
MVSAITIERMRNVYRVPADEPAPDAVRSRLDRLAIDEVVHACQSRLAELINDDDPSVWLIRSLNVDFAIDASAYCAQRAGLAWGEQLALEISRTLERGPGESVVHFPSRAAYVAQWARDMAAGCAWGKWYYSDFNSLRSLSQSSAVAEGILREASAREIVLKLHKEEALEPLLTTLTSYDAERLFRNLASGSGVDLNAGTIWVSRLLALWNSVLDPHSRTADQLRLWAAAASEWPDDADYAGLQNTIDQLLDLRDLFAQIGSAELSGQFLTEVITGNLGAAHSLLAGRRIVCSDALLNFVRTASGGNAGWAKFAANALTPDSSADREESFLSDLGGVFLLASAFRDLQIHSAVLAAAKESDEPLRAAAILRFLLAVRCLGANRASSAIHDRGVMEFAGLLSAATLDEIGCVLKAADAQSALAIVEEAMRELYGEERESEPHSSYFAIGSVFAELELEADDENAWSRIAALILRTFARRLPGFARSSPEYLFRNFLSGTSQLRVGKNSVNVSMGQCPLAVVLRIAGAYRTLALPWREGVEVCLLTPPD